jgi:predicted RNA binding protein YcfA (HicA-like mRNA interferase family)
MPNRSLLSVPVHVGRTLGPGLLRSLLRDAEVEVEAFRNAL